jgi:hypothetical protein
MATVARSAPRPAMKLKLKLKLVKLKLKVFAPLSLSLPLVVVLALVLLLCSSPVRCTDNVRSYGEVDIDGTQGGRSPTLAGSAASGRLKLAIVTLVMGENSGYASGALALGQSIKDVGSSLERIALVTPEVAESSRKSLAKLWNVVGINHIYCNHKHNLDATKYDLKGSRYQHGLSRWATTCTKFAVWNLTHFDRVIFMDSDTLVIGPIDDALYGFSNARLVAAPESFPPDMFNSGFMVISPSIDSLNKLMKINDEFGSTEGGDQGVINKFCSHWFTAGPDDPDCGRLPWLFNVQAAYYSQYKTLRNMNNLRLPAVIHFVSDGKPWKVLMYEYVPNSHLQVDAGTLKDVGKQAECHLLWQHAFFRATGDRAPKNSFLQHAIGALSSTTVANGTTGEVLADGDTPNVPKKGTKQKRKSSSR